MAYLEQDRVYIRHFVGYGAIFLQAEPRLENAILATQSQAEGGGRPDSSTENYIKSLVYGAAATPGGQVTLGPSPQSIAFAAPPTQGLLTIEQLMATTWPITFAVNADNGEARIDTYRGRIELAREGGRLAHALARMLGMKGVRANVFAPGCPVVDDDPFEYSNLESWMNP